MKTKKKDKNLGLTKQTIANLSNEEMQKVKGGVHPSYTYPCHER